MATSKKRKTKRPHTKPAANQSDSDPKKKPKGLNLRTAMRPKGLPDYDKLAAMGLSVEPKPRVRGLPKSTFPGIVPKTPEQEALERAGEVFGELWRANEGKNDFKYTLISMMTVRRMYTVLMRYLREVLAKEGAKTPDNPPPTEVLDFASQYAVTMAGRPFDETQLMDGIMQVLLPFIGGVVDKHITEETEIARSEIIARNEERVSRPVPIGFKSTPTDDLPALDREKPLVLIGWKNALRWLLDNACDEVLKATQDQQYRVVRLMTEAPRREDQHAHLIRLGTSAWKGCANTDHALDKMVMEFIEPTAGGPIDLVVADDLALCHTGGFIGRAAPAAAGDAQHRMMKWCKRLGSALLGAIPLPDHTLPDFGGPEFEQVKTFATLRAVTVHDGGQFDRDDHYRIVVGNHAAVFDVPKDIIDAAGAPRLIVPGGLVTS